MRTTSLPFRMRGLSFIGWLFFATAGMILLAAALKIVPAYMEFNTITGAVNNVLQDPKIALRSEQEIRGDIDKRFIINNVTAIKVKDLAISMEAGHVVVGIDYEVRENIFGNVDVAIVFSEEIRKESIR